MTNSIARLTLYHNQRCSKSRSVQELLVERGVDFSVVNYLDDPPTPGKLMELSNKGGFPVSELVRFGDSLAKKKGITPVTQFSNLQWCELLAENPSLIERPIIETEEDAIIGRPLQRVAVFLDS